MPRRQTRLQRVARRVNELADPLLSHRRLTHLLGLGPIRLRYVGRRSGSTFELPAYGRLTDDELLVTVGAAAHKGWWRNFRTARPLEVRLDGTWRAASAVVREPRPGKVQVVVTWEAPTS